MMALRSQLERECFGVLEYQFTTSRSSITITYNIIYIIS